MAIFPWLNGIQTAYQVADELKLWQLGEEQIPLNFISTIKMHILSFHGELKYLSSKSKQSRKDYQERKTAFNHMRDSYFDVAKSAIDTIMADTKDERSEGTGCRVCASSPSK